MTGFKLKLAVSAVLSLGVIATGAGVLAKGQGVGNRKAVAGEKNPTQVLREIVPGSDVARIRVIELFGDRAKLDGQVLSFSELSEALMSPGGGPARPISRVILRVASDRKYSEVARVVEVIQDAGIRDIRFESAELWVVTKLEQPISLSIIDQPLLKAITSIEDAAGLSIILHLLSTGERARKPVTLQVHQVKLKSALNDLLRPLQLAYRVEGDHLFVIPAVESADRPPVQLRKNLEIMKARLAGARLIARDESDPAIKLAAQEIAETEAELDRIEKRPADVLDDAVPPKPVEGAMADTSRVERAYHPRRVEELVKPDSQAGPSSPPANPGRVGLNNEARQRTEPPREFSKVSMPRYVVEPPDIITVEVLGALKDRPITGKRLVRPDGTISLGVYGDVYVSGLTTSEIKAKVALHLRDFLGDKALGLSRVVPDTGQMVRVEPARSDRIIVDVEAYNSKVYYVQGDVGVPGRLPITGNETVLDAINYAGGLIPTASRVNIRLVRPAPPGAQGESVLAVDLTAIINRGDSTTNYQIMAGDRLVVSRDPKYEPAGPSAEKKEAAVPPEVEARLQALERKLDEVLKALERPAKP